MTVEEMEKLVQAQEKRRQDIKKQNESAKKRWDSVSCRLPAGTKARIEHHGFTTNGLINTLVLAELDRLDKLEQLKK